MKNKAPKIGIFINKADMPEHPTDLHKDVISGICHEAIEKCKVVKHAHGVTWVTEWWGYVDYANMWFFVFDNAKRPAIGLCTIVLPDFATLCPDKLAEKPLYILPAHPAPYDIPEGKNWL